MGLNLNLSRVSGNMDSLKNTAFKDIPPGRGMVIAKEFKEFGFTKGKNPGHELTLEIVAWTDPEGVGKEHKEIIFTDDGSREEDQCAARLMKIAIASGMLTPREAEDARNGSGEIDLDFTTGLQGRPIMIEIVKRKGKDEKEYTNVGEGGFAFYHCKDPRVSEWPRHVPLINQNGHLIGEWEPLKKDSPAPSKASSKKASNPFAGKM